VRLGSNKLMTFRWLGPLGLSVALFLVIGLLWVLVGVLTPFLLDRGGGLFVNHRTDSAYFGASPEVLLAADPALGKLRTVLLTVIAGFPISLGVTFLAVAWFALKEGRVWGLLTLAIAGVVAVLLWAVSLAPYYRAGIGFTLGDLPPFMWVPALLIIPGTILRRNEGFASRPGTRGRGGGWGGEPTCARSDFRGFPSNRGESP